MIRHIALALLCFVGSLAVVVTPVHAEPYQWTVANTLEAIEAVDPAYREWVRDTVRCETGGTFNPMLVNRNDSGYGPSRGPAQINERLQGQHYRDAGYTDPHNPYEAVEYLWFAFRGDYRAQSIGWWRWSCA